MSTEQTKKTVTPNTEGQLQDVQDSASIQRHYMDNLKEHLFPLCSRYQQTLLRAYLKELDRELSPVDGLATMESQICGLFNALPKRTRCLIGILSTMAVMDDIPWANDLLNNGIEAIQIDEWLYASANDNQGLILKKAWTLCKQVESLRLSQSTVYNSQ